MATLEEASKNYAFHSLSVASLTVHLYWMEFPIVLAHPGSLGSIWIIREPLASECV